MFIQQTHFGLHGEIRCGHVNGVHNSDDHIHQFCEIEMILEGEIEITVSGKVYVASAGDIAVIPPFKVHSFYTPRHVKMLICTLSSYFLPPSISAEELLADRDAHVFKAPAALWNYLIQIDFHNTKTMREINTDEDQRKVLQLRATIHLILSEYLLTANKLTEGKSDNALSKILIYISDHYKEPLSLTSISTATGYSQKYVSNCVSKIKVLNLRSFINMLRIDEAKSRLRTSDSTILTIALECGFKNESSFYRVFYTLTGVTPKEYRKKYTKTKNADTRKH